MTKQLQKWIIAIPKTILSDPIAVRLPEDILADIEVVAETCDKSRRWVVVRALKRAKGPISSP
jgi:hypothetical protein